MRKFTLILLIVSIQLSAQVYTQSDIDVCDAKFELAKVSNLSLKPINEVIVTIGKSFLGTEYEAHTLERDGNEELIVNLTGLDCYTFLESSLVLSRLIKSGNHNFVDFTKELTNVRYRDGKIDEYPSRLHYFSDWIYEMDRRGISKDVTERLGGKCYTNEVNFMSNHPQSYKQLKNNEGFIVTISEIEKNISKRKYFYIEQDEIEKYEEGIVSGDVIGITTYINGLDIAHTGIAVKMEDGRIHLMHAPNVGKKVQITKVPLADYVKKNKIQTGIMVSRPLEP